jgi:hypothetical protein
MKAVLITGTIWANDNQLQTIKEQFPPSFFKEVAIGVNSMYPNYICICATDNQDRIFTPSIGKDGLILDENSHLY